MFLLALLLYLGPAIAAISTGIALGASGGRLPGRRRTLGTALIGLGALLIVLAWEWYTSACWDTGSPCDGSFLYVVFAAAWIACVVLSIAVGLFALWRRLSSPN